MPKCKSLTGVLKFFMLLPNSLSLHHKLENEQFGLLLTMPYME